MSLDKYKWKCRLLVIYTPNYKNRVYLKTKEVYQKEIKDFHKRSIKLITCLLYTSPSPRDGLLSRMPSSA